MCPESERGFVRSGWPLTPGVLFILLVSRSSRTRLFLPGFVCARLKAWPLLNSRRCLLLVPSPRPFSPPFFLSRDLSTRVGIFRMPLRALGKFASRLRKKKKHKGIYRSSAGTNLLNRTVSFFNFLGINQREFRDRCYCLCRELNVIKFGIAVITWVLGTRLVRFAITGSPSNCDFTRLRARSGSLVWESIREKYRQMRARTFTVLPSSSFWKAILEWNYKIEQNYYHSFKITSSP